MSACSPQRYLANNRNIFATATLTPSSVLPVANQVQRIPFARRGTAIVSLAGTYTGQEPADYEIEIVDTDVEIPRVSTPVFSGVGSGTISDIVASGVQQSYRVECSDAGTNTTTASVQIEGVTIKALAAGAGGNSIRFAVDQSPLVFAASDYSLLEDLSAGEDSFSGQGFDWDAAVIDGNGNIPASAHRVVIGDDRTNVHLSYKEFVDGAWQYRLIPALTRDIPKGAAIYFVTGGRDVAVTDGVDSETYEDIVTAYDLLIALRTESALVVVDGVVANDRSPSGQAARELSLRTDAHAEVSYGVGSVYAAGVENVTVAADAGTQLITLTCVGTSAADHPLARLGRERWTARSSLLGSLGTITTGLPYLQPSGVFGLTIPVKLPDGFGTPKGRFSAVDVTYATATETPICPVALTLGPDAIDQTITLRYTPRPTGDCVCSGMPVPDLDTACLGNTKEGGGLMAYKPDTIERLVDLRVWSKDLIREWSAYGAGTENVNPSSSAAQAGAVANPRDNSAVDGSGSHDGNYHIFGMALATKSLKQLVAQFEDTIALIDPLAESSPPGYREAGMTAWDDAVTELKTDIADLGSPPPYQYNLPSDRYLAAMELALTSAGLPVSGGADANTLESGDGCWRDYGDAAYWTVTGSEHGEYGPLFTNKPYFSARKGPSGGYFSTHEFALQLNVRCPEDLQEGDTVTLQINDASWGATYQRGDLIYLPIVAASPHSLSGGATGDPTQTWNVHGTEDGPKAPYSFNPDAPAPYIDGDLSFLLNEGGIPFAKGDRFTFAIEGGHFRWRKNGGAWQDESPPLPIPLDSVLIDEGLSATFSTGAANSFFDGDVYKFRARQPWSANNLRTPSVSRWKWDGASASLDVDCGAITTIDILAFVHDLPVGATVTVELGGRPLLNEDGESLLNENGEPLLSDDYDESINLTWRRGIIWGGVALERRYLRISVANADGGSIQFAWAGEPVTTSLSGEFQKRLEYGVSKPGGNLQGGRYRGRAVSGDVTYTENALKEADAEALIAMLDYIKAQNDQPILFIPNVARPTDEVLFARVEADQLELHDRAAYNQTDSYERRVSARIPFEGVMQ